MSTDSLLDGRVAVITGASSGIGEATARTLAAKGAKVALLARRGDRLASIAEEITADGGTAVAYPVDVTDAHAVKGVAQTIQDELGTVSILFNNAGIMLPAPIEELHEDQWSHQVDLNISALNTVIGAFLSQLVDSARSAGVADLVNTASIAGKNLFPTFAVYSASKAYVIHLSNHLRTELGPQDIRVSAIEPGIVGTELQSHVTDQGATDWLEGSKDTLEWLTAQDVADVVAFTVSLPRRVNLQEIAIMPTRQTA
jgi:NADP-dependent 3-hydroxy acid dehydrogenase YdfG